MNNKKIIIEKLATVKLIEGTSRYVPLEDSEINNVAKQLLEILIKGQIICTMQTENVSHEIIEEQNENRPEEIEE